MHWLRKYALPDLPKDLAAGFTLGAVLIPSGLAYGELAGLPMAGLYACIAPLLAYALVGPSRLLALGTDTAMATFVALTFGPMAQGDPVRLAALVALLGCTMAAIFLVAGLLRLGFMADFLSKSVIAGFTHGLAVVILAAQLPNVLGIQAGTGTALEKMAATFGRLGETRPGALIIGALSIAVVLACQRLVPRVPGQIVVLAGGLAASYLFDLEGAGIPVVGPISSGLPQLSVPHVSLGDVGAMLAPALGASLLIFSDTIVTARGIAARNRERVDANRELLGLSASNLASGLTQGLPVSGNGSPTAVAFSAGARTQATLMVAAATVTMALLFLTPYFAMLPMATLGGILIAAADPLCDFPELGRLWRFRSVTLFTALAVTAAVASFGVTEGIALGVLISLVLVLKTLAFPNDSVRSAQGAIVYRFSAPLFFANAALFQSRVRTIVEQAEQPFTLFVLDASVVFEVDIAGCDAVNDTAAFLRQRDIRLVIAGLSPYVAQTFARAGVTGCVGAENIVPSVEEVLKPSC